MVDYGVDDESEVMDLDDSVGTTQDLVIDLIECLREKRWFHGF